jgi:ATP-binding cassette subfamily B protein
LASITAAPTEYDLKKAFTPNRLVGLWRMLTGYRFIYFIAALTQGTAGLAKTATFFLLRYFIDNVLGVGSTSALRTGSANLLLATMALGFVGLALMEGSSTYLSGRLAAKAAESVARRLRNYLFDHMQRLSFAYHSKTPTGELIQRSTSDVDALRRFYAEQAIGVGRIVLMFVINFTAICYLDRKLGLISVAVMPLIILVSLLFFNRISKLYEAYQEQEATLSTTLQENLSGVRVVKAFARQEYERQKFNKDNLEKFERGKRLGRMHAIFWPATDVLCTAQLLGGLLFAGLMAINGQISVGTYLAYAGMVGWLIWPLRQLGRLIVQTSTGLVSYQRVMEVIKQDREPLTDGDYQPKQDCKGRIEFKNVSFAYEGDNEVLKDISFTCEPGQAVALLGSTGSGKTTLMNLLPRFYEYTSGSLTLDGIELTRYPRRYLRQQIGIVEQEPFLFSRSLRENITYSVGRTVSDAEVEAAARAAAIHDVILTFPEGYSTLVGEKGVTLSGGQKQRVAIARTLLKNPRILILDDSTSSVDLETEAEIRSALENLMHGRTTFIIAHRIQSVMEADLILVMDKGRIIQRGSHTELISQPGVYRKIYEIQTRIETELEQEITGSQEAQSGTLRLADMHD